jgi:hypothetical protein
VDEEYKGSTGANRENREWSLVKRVLGESTIRFQLRGSTEERRRRHLNERSENNNLESVDSAGFVKITRNDPDVGIATIVFL